MTIRNPNDNVLQQILAELKELRFANPLRSTSVEKGRTRFYGGSQLLIEDSNLDVTGTATIIGTLRTVGRIILEGLGILTVNGLIELFGRMRVTGGGGITVEGGGDIEVDGGEIRIGNVILKDGKILAGGMTINPDVNGGQIEFGDGRTINAGTGFLGVYDGDRQVIFNSSGVTIVAGGRSFAVGPAGIRVTGAGTIAQADVPDSFIGAAVIDSSGLLLRVVV